jgi:hypothetical protein
MAPSYPLMADEANAAKSAEKPVFADELITIGSVCLYCETSFVGTIFVDLFWGWRRVG